MALFNIQTPAIRLNLHKKTVLKTEVSMLKTHDTPQYFKGSG